MEKIIISCLESRVETNRSMYARFLLGPFKDDNAITIATALRRSLLSKVKSIAITAIHIQGVTHEFSTIVGVRESVLDLALNFQQVVLRTKTGICQFDKSYAKTKLMESQVNGKPSFATQRKSSTFATQAGKKQSKDQSLFRGEHLNKVEAETVQIGYLQVQGPAVIYANDLKLPAGIECVDPSQYIATLSTEGLLVVKFLIGKKKASLNNQNGVLTGNKTNIDLAVTKQDFVPAYTKSSSLYANTRNETLTSARLQPDNQMESQYNSLSNPFRSFDSTNCLRNTIFLDPIFDSVIQANYVIEKDDLFNQVRERILLEFWTNGSVHPRQALHKASLSLTSTFSIFRKVFHLDSL